MNQQDPNPNRYAHQPDAHLWLLKERYEHLYAAVREVHMYVPGDETPHVTVTEPQPEPVRPHLVADVAIAGSTADAARAEIASIHTETAPKGNTLPIGELDNAA